MPRTRSIAWAELKLGLVGIVALMLLVAIIVAVGGQGGFWWDRYPLKTQFDKVDGLKAGAVVRLNGKEVGQVKSVDFAGPHLDVGLQVNKDVRSLITTDSVASVGSLSLLGEPIIDISAAGTGTPLADWQYVKSGKAAGPLGEIQDKAGQTMDQANALLADMRAGKGTIGKLMTDQALYNEMQAFIASAGDVTRGLSEGHGTLGALAKDPAAYNALRASLQNLETLTDRINRGEGTLGKLANDDALAKSLSATAANTEQLTAQLRNGQGTAGRLMTDRELYDHLNNFSAKIDQLAQNLNDGRGTAGQLLHDQRLYDNMNTAVTELRGLLSDIRKDPKKYLRVSVSIF